MIIYFIMMMVEIGDYLIFLSFNDILGEIGEKDSFYLRGRRY